MVFGERGCSPEGARSAGALRRQDENLDGLLAAAWDVRRANFAPEIRFVRPRATLPVSLTGPDCALDCAHCGGHYLARMASLTEALEGKTPRAQRARSFLVSGGCLPGGAVPFARFLPELRRLKSRGRLNVHPGLVAGGEARVLGELADAVSFDLVGDDATIREVLGLQRTVLDYRRSLRALRRYARVVPHILVGLHAGALRGERAALQAAAAEGAEEIVFIVLIPTPGTRFAGCLPPVPEEVAGLIAEARIALPGVSLALGCMRPGGAYRTRLDALALRAGVQKIVQPSPAAVRSAPGLGLSLVWAEECCVL